MLNLGRAVAVATGIIVVVNLFVPERDLPLSVNMAAGLFAFVGMGGSKLWPRITRGAWGSRVEPGRRVLIAGAGNTGQMIAREFREHPAGPTSRSPSSMTTRGSRASASTGSRSSAGRADLGDVLRDYEIDWWHWRFPRRRATSSAA